MEKQKETIERKGELSDGNNPTGNTDSSEEIVSDESDETVFDSDSASKVLHGLVKTRHQRGNTRSNKRNTRSNKHKRNKNLKKTTNKGNKSTRSAGA